ncbi:unnamed protein product [Onchocerca flexuosa]|uniref:PRESAN domain-containing protein n=1 Tax=Onchocerca flexuosa TaxID=387005 RepID=A0A183I6G3_9BILA|nr:unnamed protein product [Onchocerca flexuosa]
MRKPIRSYKRFFITVDPEFDDTEKRKEFQKQFDYRIQMLLSQWMMSKEELLKHIDDIEWNNEKIRPGHKRKHSSGDR